FTHQGRRKDDEGQAAVAWAGSPSWSTALRFAGIRAPERSERITKGAVATPCYRGVACCAVRATIDCIVVARLDRMARSLAHMAALGEEPVLRMPHRQRVALGPMSSAQLV